MIREGDQDWSLFFLQKLYRIFPECYNLKKGEKNVENIFRKKCTRSYKR